MGCGTFRDLLLTYFVLCFNNNDCVQGKGELDYIAVFLPQHADTPQNGTNILEITAAVDTTGTMEIPFPYKLETFTIFAGKVKRIELNRNVRTSMEEFNSRKAIHIRTSSPVTVKGISVTEASADSFLALPLGTEFTHFRSISYTEFNARQKCFVTVASLIGKNIVTVTSTRDVSFRYRQRYYRNGQSLRVPLNRLNVLQVESQDVTGLLITSYSPVAVYSGCSCVSVPSFTEDCDHIVEQIPPMSTWGVEFVSAALAPRQSGETYRVLSSCNETSVSVNGQHLGTVNEGEFVEFKSNPSITSWITCSSACLVAMFLQGHSTDNRRGDPAMAILPHTSQFLSSATTVFSGKIQSRDVRLKRAFNNINHYLMIITKSEHKVGILLDGQVLRSGRVWRRVANTDYSVTTFSLTVGKHTIDHTNPKVKFGLISYGLGVGLSYAHPVGMDFTYRWRSGCKIKEQLGPANIMGGVTQETEITSHTDMRIVIPLACVCVFLMMCIAVLLVITKRLRRNLSQLEQQKKIIIVPRANNPNSQAMSRTGTMTVNLATGVPLTATPGQDSPPPYLELIDDPS